MRQFANYFNIAPTFWVSSVTDTALNMKTGKTATGFITRNEVEPKTDTEDKPAGHIYNFELNAAVEKLTDSEKRIYANNAPIILELIDADTFASKTIGTLENPANITLVPGTDHDELKITFSSTAPIL